MNNEEKEYLRKRKEKLMERRKALPRSPMYRCQWRDSFDHVQLLLDSGLCSKQEIDRASDEALKNETPVSGMIRTGKIDRLEFTRICAVKANVRFIEIPGDDSNAHYHGREASAFEWSQRLRGRATNHYLPMVPLPFHGHSRIIAVSDPLCIQELQEMVEEDATEEEQRPYRPCPWRNDRVEYVSAPLEQINATIDAGWEWYLKRGETWE